MIRQTLALLILTLTFLSCKRDLLGDSKIAADICEELGAEHCKYYFSTDQKSGRPELKNYIELEIYGCKTLNSERTNKRALASYAATQLYNRLDPNSIIVNAGINIIFDSIDDILKDKELFYDMKELENAWTAFNLIDSYLNAVRDKDSNRISTLIDTSYFDLNLSATNKEIRETLERPIISSSSIYSYYDFQDNSGRTIKCLTIATNLKHADQNFSRINALVIDSPSDKRIINIKSGP